MKTFKATCLSTALLLTLGAAPFVNAETSADPSGAPADAAAETTVVATVNGEPITQEMLQIYGAQRSRNPGAQPISPEAALEELVNIELVTQDAEKHNIDERPNVLKQLDWQRRSLLVGVSMREYVAQHPVTDEELQNAYKAHIKNHDGHEYHARHILLETEDEAKAVISELGKGGDFAKLATEKSKDPSGKQGGGDLGWFSSDQMVKPFSDAVARMKKGEVSKQPVESQFGWHVIKLEDTRDVEPPSFDTLKDQLRMQLQNARVDAYLAALREDAKIDIKK